jgi:NAD+ synthase
MKKCEDYQDLKSGHFSLYLTVMENAGKGLEGLKLNVDAVRTILTGFIRDEAVNAGFSKVVLGLSGGVDSALVAWLAAAALGPENVRAVLLPYSSSSPDSLSDALSVVRALGIAHEIIDISPAVDACISKLGDLSNVRRGNVMARQRMIVLYDCSARENALVLGTSNKTELLLGYGTQFGDLACAINPIGDLYKTQVWQLSAALGVPAAIVSKKPTADLWAGQTDEEELGFTYRQVDQLLYYMVDERRTDAELMEYGFEEHFIEKVRRLIRRNQFKRRPPIIAKVSNRTLNIDFRYARDWGI